MKSVGALFHGALVASSAAPCGATNLAVENSKLLGGFASVSGPGSLAGNVSGQFLAVFCQIWGPQLF